MARSIVLKFALQATLLLPTEPAHSHENITVDFVKDHIILCDGPSRDNANIVTLSGLRGRLSKCVFASAMLKLPN